MRSGLEPGRKGFSFSWLVNLELVWFSVAALVLYFHIANDLARSFQFNADEGLNLIKAFLFGAQYELYTQIWSDQPPLFTAILAGAFYMFEPSVLVARSVVFFLSATGLFLFFRVVRLDHGPFAGILAVMFLVLTQWYVRISVGIFLMSPMLTFCLASLYFARLYQLSEKSKWLVLSGVVFGAALCVKLLAWVFFPAVIYCVISQEFSAGPARGQGRLIRRFVIFCLLVFSSAVLIVLLVSPGLFSSAVRQLIDSHLGAHEFLKVRGAFSGVAQLEVLLIKDAPIALLGGISVTILVLLRSPRTLVPGILLASSVVFMFMHSPIWFHHYPLVGIPVSWFAAAGLTTCFSRARSGLRRRCDLRSGIFLARAALAICVVWFALGLPERAGAAYSRFSSPDSRCQRRVAQHIAEQRHHVRWLFTDLPMIAFLAQVPVPPEYAVISNKRLRMSSFSPEQLATGVLAYRPEYIYLWRFKELQRELELFFEEDYELECGTGLYKRKDLPFEVEPLIGCCK